MHRLTRVLALAIATSLLTTGCMLSRLVDRAFLGITVRRPTYNDRKTTGIFLLPLTFAIDVATFPLQALLVVILGDNFPFPETSTMVQIALNDSPQFQKLSPERKALAQRELEQLIQSGQVTKDTAVALGEDGHWTVVAVTPEARAQLLARAANPTSPTALACVAP